jgi:hypothetical protein
VASEPLRRLSALLSITLRLIANARSGRVALAQLAIALDPAWIPSPAGDDLVAQMQEAARAARKPLAMSEIERCATRGAAGPARSWMSSSPSRSRSRPEPRSTAASWTA